MDIIDTQVNMEDACDGIERVVFSEVVENSESDLTFTSTVFGIPNPVLTIEALWVSLK